MIGKRFRLRKDHHGHKYLFDQPNLNARKSRWLDLISEFDFEIKHVKWKENKIFDVLRRRLHMTHMEALSSFILDLKYRFSEVVISDVYYEKMKGSTTMGYLSEVERVPTKKGWNPLAQGSSVCA